MAERRPLRRRSIRVRLVVRTLAAAAVVLLAAGWAATTVVDKQLRQQIDRRLEDDIKGAVVAVDVLTPEQQATMSQRNTMSKYAVIVVGREAVRVASAPAGAGDVAGAAGGLTVERLSQEDGDAFTLEGSPDLRVAAQPMSDGLYLAFAAPLGEVSSAISTVRWAALLIGVCALGLLAVLVSLIGRSVVRPLEEMIDAADAIGAGDLDRRAPDGQADAESERLAVALNAMLERLATSFREQQASERELRDFVSEAAHELRTPLATVQASAEILSETTLDPADVAVVARRVNTQTRRMAHLVDDLVLLARLQQGADLEQIDLNICDVAEGAVDRATARQPGWPTRLDVPSEPIVVAGDPVRLEQILDDLLDNIAVHTPVGTTAVVRVKDHGSQVVIEVHDDGPGLPRADLERACERLYRGEAARLEGRPGSGLGLAIVRGVVEAHGGTLVLRDGDGFTAEITLPVSAATGRSDTEPAATRRSDTEPAARSRVR